MEKLNQLLGIKILNIWIMRYGGVPLFIKKYEGGFAYLEKGATDPMIMAMLDGYLAIFNKRLIGYNCEKMVFGGIFVFSIYYTEEPIPYTTITISQLIKKMNIQDDYLKAITETIGKMFGNCYSEVLKGLEIPPEQFREFENEINNTYVSFAEKLCDALSDV